MGQLSKGILFDKSIARELHKGGVAMNQLSTEDLKQYLFHVRDLEASCYKQREYINFLQQSMNRANNPQMNAMIKDKKTESEFGGFAGCGLCLSIGIVGAIIFGIIGLLAVAMFGGWQISDIFGRFALIKIASFGFIVGFLGAIIGKIFAKIKNNASDKAENRKISEQNKELAEKNELIRDRSKTRAMKLATEISKARMKLDETEKILLKYYASDIIYTKYQGLIPVTMFCEYFASGRCDTLTGHEGAYNIYENEIRLNLIIVKLEEVVDKLDQIQQNQYMLASMLEQNNRELQSIKSAVSMQTATLERIEDNTEVSNYYNRITAANTDFLAWAKTYELIRNS